METSATTGATSSQATQAATSSSDAWGDIDLDQFVKLLITELQSQDPLDPMNNAEILQQVSQIREISSNDKLMGTLDSVRMSQNVSTASSLIGQMVMGLSDDAEFVTGKVDSASIVDGVAKLHIGDYEMNMDNVSQILGDPASTEDES